MWDINQKLSPSDLSRSCLIVQLIAYGVRSAEILFLLLILVLFSKPRETIWRAAGGCEYEFKAWEGA